MEKEAIQNKGVEERATVKEFIKLFSLSKTPRTIQRQIKKGKWETKNVGHKYMIPIIDLTYTAKLRRLRELRKKPMTKKLTIALPTGYKLDEEFLKTIIDLAEYSPEKIPIFVKRHEIKIPEEIYMRIREIAKKIHIRHEELIALLLMFSQKNNQKEVEDDSINSN